MNRARGQAATPTPTPPIQQTLASYQPRTLASPITHAPNAFQGRMAPKQVRTLASPLTKPLPVEPTAPQAPAGFVPGAEAAAQTALDATYQGPRSLQEMQGYSQLQQDA